MKNVKMMTTIAPAVKTTQTRGETHSMKTEPVLGNCYGDKNPDAWFPEPSRGGPSQAKMRALGLETSRAIILCKACPKKEECLEEGMKPKNLPYGIWGGKLAGQRILMADEQGIDYMVEGRTGGTRIAVGTVNDTGRGAARGFVVIKENGKVTVEEKRSALNLLRLLKPWIKE